MGHVDGGGPEPLVQLLDLRAHLHPQLGVEIAERLVEQEDLRVAHDGPAHGDALALSFKETIESGAGAAAAGGFTTIVCMPNTSPVADNPATIAWIRDRAAEVACVNVLPTGPISKEFAGEELAPIGSLARRASWRSRTTGIAFRINELMRRAVEYARMVGCRCSIIVRITTWSATAWSTKVTGAHCLGCLAGPAAGEEAIVMRNILLAELCDHHVHCQHVSAAGSVRIMREAQARGMKISGEVCPHHIALTDEAIQNFDTNCKMNPPLRAQGGCRCAAGGNR